MAARLAASLKAFVDRSAVAAAVDKSTLRLFARVGAFVRTRARSSMRRRKAPSAPGSPPSAHAGTLKRLLFFGVEAGSGGPTVVVGPTLFGRRQSPLTTELQEYGGVRRGEVRTLLVKHKPGRDARGKFVVGGVAKVERRGLLRYPARPFMQPAFEAETRGGKLAAQLKDYIRS